MTGIIKSVVFCGPSGSGKTTLLKRLLEDYPDRFGFSVSHTSRKPRSGEQEGVHYHFDTVENMNRQISEGKFIESATFSGNLYGTSKAAVENVCKQGKICLLDIDMQGVIQVKKTDFNPVCIFVKPPSLEMLEKRLRARESETEESLKRRLDTAVAEINYGNTPGNFDIVIMNDDLDHAYSILKKFVEKKFFDEKRRVECNGKQ